MNADSGGAPGLKARLSVEDLAFKFSLNGLALVHARLEGLALSLKDRLELRLRALSLSDDVCRYASVLGLHFTFARRVIDKSRHRARDLLLPAKDAADGESLASERGEFAREDGDSPRFARRAPGSFAESEASSPGHGPDFAFEKNLTLVLESVDVKVNTNLLSRLLFLKRRVADVFVGLFDPAPPSGRSSLTSESPGGLRAARLERARGPRERVRVALVHLRRELHGEPGPHFRQNGPEPLRSGRAARERWAA